MLFVSREVIENMRRVVIQLLGILDDALELPRTIPDKDERKTLRLIQEIHYGQSITEIINILIEQRTKANFKRKGITEIS